MNNVYGDFTSHYLNIVTKTKGQALCNGCREETHRAKMFSAHDIIPVSKYAKEAPKRVRTRNSFC